eukprot:2281045-Prymnesium_polylepis.1
MDAVSAQRSLAEWTLCMLSVQPSTVCMKEWTLHTPSRERSLLRSDSKMDAMWPGARTQPDSQRPPL